MSTFGGQYPYANSPHGHSVPAPVQHTVGRDLFTPTHVRTLQSARKRADDLLLICYLTDILWAAAGSTKEAVSFKFRTPHNAV